MNIVLMGPPGSGKSTQAKLLSEKLQLPYIKTGEIYREFAKSGAPLSRMVRETLESGGLVEDEITFEIVDKYLSAISGGFVLDGFPRTLVQAKRELVPIDKVINIALSEEEATGRILERAKIENRADDTPDVVKHRFELYHQMTEPILDYYRRQNKLIEIDGSPSVPEVEKLVWEAVNK